MAVAVELEDDLVFADLSRQISLLIMEDDEAYDRTTAAIYNPPHSFQRICGATNLLEQSMFGHEQHCKSKGTGVFIPRMSRPRRKQRQQQPKSQSRRRSDK